MIEFLSSLLVALISLLLMVYFIPLIFSLILSFNSGLSNGSKSLVQEGEEDEL